MQKILDAFFKIKTHTRVGKPSLHKPLLLLFCLGRCYRGEKRMMPFAAIDYSLKRLFEDFYPEASERNNTHYPFGKLENDGIWEIEKSLELKRTSVGHLFKSELFEKNIHGGFKKDVFDVLSANKDLVFEIAQEILKIYFPEFKRKELLMATGFSSHEKSSDMVNDSLAYYVKKENNFVYGNVQGESVKVQQNSFITYLNSLHNLGADGVNALAESQVLNKYFINLYEPFAVVDIIYNKLLDSREKVIILTGHAGDGKSTVAFDIIKKLKKIPDDGLLDRTPQEREIIGNISIVKDMSELEVYKRLDWLFESFSNPGSWLIISNTGPLLNSLAEYAQEQGVPGEIESQVLKKLDEPINDDLSNNTLEIFPKPLVIINMARLDNVILGTKVFSNMINHSGWEHCSGCEIYNACPIRLNQQGLRECSDTIEDRIRWIYQRLQSYEQRLTLRQIVAHLALSMTGGMSCAEATETVSSSTAEGVNRGTVGLEKIVFSESFFGFKKGKPWLEAESLRAINLLRRLVFGGPMDVSHDRKISMEELMGWAYLPNALTGLVGQWRSLAKEHDAVNWRFALRRMIYIFGQPSSSTKYKASFSFIDAFLQSPQLRNFDSWVQSEEIKLKPAERNRLTKLCLRVLLEVFSGFSSGQFHENHDRLYITLKRSDEAVVQPTQLVVAEFRFDDFKLSFNTKKNLPVLQYRETGIELDLNLPLLDYIHKRSNGEIGSGLARIHLAQLEWFRAKLLEEGRGQIESNNIRFLRADIKGDVHLHGYFLDEEENILERS